MGVSGLADMPRHLRRGFCGDSFLVRFVDDAANSALTVNCDENRVWRRQMLFGHSSVQFRMSNLDKAIRNFNDSI